MGRDIKFRAKRLDRYEWVYGNLVRIDDDYRIIEQAAHNNMVVDCLVVAETVGQFTGLNDKNGAEIYEGDIVESQNMRKGIVKYFESLTWEGGGSHPGFYCRSWFDAMEMEEHGIFYYQDFDGCEVIGNIHEGVKQ